MSLRPGLRGRLLAALVLVSVTPLVAMAVATVTLLSRSFERATGQRLQDTLKAAEREVARRQRQAALLAETVVRDDLPARSGEASWSVAGDLAGARSVDVLEIVDGSGRVLSSAHWPAGFGLPDRDAAFPGQDALRVETVGEGHGSAQRLAVTAARPGRWAERPVVVRAGYFIDDAFVQELSALTGVDVALRDDRNRRWIAPTGSGLSAWREPDLAERGSSSEVTLGSERYRWSARALAPGLWLVAALSPSSLESVTLGVRRLALGLAAGVLLVAVTAAVVLSGRIAEPVRELAEGARRVAAGDLERTVPVSGAGEVAELASAFNQMTTELRDSRERLLQAERVAAWREMARRLAHELKNPIFPIQLSIETLRRMLDQDPQGRDGTARFTELFRESSETILDALASLRKIIDEFSQFARMPRPELRPLDVNAVVEQAVSLYRPRAERLTVEMELAPGLPAVAADRDQLARALGNLLANAIEAMAEGGTLRVRTAPEAPGVRVEVEDTGPGLDEKERTRLFTPYYTTKRGGTGLGLAIVQGVISDHGGRVQVKSEPGRGTTFTLLLPAAS
jgi:two-component system nitrogen regulation sensor histidine kinase NtrY